MAKNINARLKKSVDVDTTQKTDDKRVTYSAETVSRATSYMQSTVEDTARSSYRKIKKIVKPAAILMRSTPDTGLLTDSWSSDSEYESSDLEVEYKNENVEMDNAVILARITRLGNFKGIWNSSSEFLTLALAFLISPDAIVSAIYGFRRFGAQIWWPQVLGMWFIAFPVMFLEFSLGQYTSSSTVSVFKYMVPFFTAISAVSILMNFIITLNDFQLLAMTASVLRDIWSVGTGQFRAATCFNAWNDIACKTALNPCAKISAETGSNYIPIQGRCVQERWYTDILQKDITKSHQLRELTPQFHYFLSHLTGSNNKGSVNEEDPCSEMFVYLSFTFFILFLLQVFPHRVVLKLAKIPLYMLAVFFSTVLVCSWFNPEIDQIGFPIKDDSIDFQDKEFYIWFVGHILYVSKIGQGCLITIGSQNPFRNRLFLQVLFLAVVAFTVPHLFAYLLYPYMDKLLWKYAGDFNKFEEEKPAFFEIYNRLFNTIWSDALLAFFADERNGKVLGTLFIATIMSIFFIHKIIRLRTLVLPMLEHFNVTSFADLHIIRRAVLYIVFMGFFNKYLIPHKTIAFYSTIAGSAAIVIYEIICVLICYGPRRYFCTLDMMEFGVAREKNDQKKVRFYSILMIVGILTLLIVAIIFGIYFVFSIIKYIEAIKQHWWVAVIGGMIFVFVIPAYGGLKFIMRRRRNLLARNLWKPISELWGPREVNDRKRAEYQERNMRVG